MATDWAILASEQVVKYCRSEKDYLGSGFGGSEIPRRMQTILGSFPLNIARAVECFGRMLALNLKLMTMKLRQMQFEIS